MANRYFNPDVQYLDSAGLPYSGGQLFFYASGTSTKLNTYSDAGLTIANTNPVILDSAGRAGPIFLQNLQYKVMLATATDTDPPTSPVWTEDPVYTSDYSTAAQFASGSGSPNGVVAGTAGSATIKASSYWDYTNNILYICTTTGTASTAVWTAINAATASAVVVSPQGRLTPTTGTPVINTDVTAATTVYYTPYTGLLVPIYNGTSFIPTSMVSELQYTLTSSLVASNIYDLFAFSNSGVVTLGSGPSWSAGTGGSITAGSCARGTGANGAALSRVQGVLTNAVSMTVRYGDGTKTATVNANQATYLGSMFMDATNGQVSCYVTIGKARKFGIWNAYNRQAISLQVQEATSSWTYSSSGYRPSNNSADNSASVFCGLAEETQQASFSQFVQSSASQATVIGIGYNSTTSPSGKIGGSNNGSSANMPSDAIAAYDAPPALGINTVTCLESSPGSATSTYNGGSRMLMRVGYRG